jgi:hypothetical protein
MTENTKNLVLEDLWHIRSAINDIKKLHSDILLRLCTLKSAESKRDVSYKIGRSIIINDKLPLFLDVLNESIKDIEEACR